MDYKDLLFEKKDGVAVITLNAPEKLNAITEGIFRGLPVLLGEISRDDQIRVAIITGGGRGFCSGADLAGPISTGIQSQSRAERYRTIGDIVENLPRLRQPLIAAINGACAGGGLSLALACDIRIASTHARFKVSQMAVGLVPDLGMTYTLPMAVGMSKALELIYTAEAIDAVEALKIGLVSKTVAPDELMPCAREMASKIAAQAPLALEFAKRAVWTTRMEGLARQLDIETSAFRVTHGSQDFKNAVAAFKEKRPPQFKGE